MKNWILEFQEIDKQNFDDIRTSIKPIETRAATAKYQQIQEGDSLTFVCGTEQLSKKISRKFYWPSIDEMVTKIPLKKIMPHVSSVEEMKTVYASYLGYEEKIKEFGLVGFELK